MLPKVPASPEPRSSRLQQVTCCRHLQRELCCHRRLTGAWILIDERRFDGFNEPRAKPHTRSPSPSMHVTGCLKMRGLLSLVKRWKEDVKTQTEETSACFLVMSRGRQTQLIKQQPGSVLLNRDTAKCLDSKWTPVILRRRRTAEQR